MAPFVSIIVPIFNTQQYIRKCVESLMNQTMKNIEIILIDDGSTDGSPAMIDAFAGSDDRIKVIHQKNQGVSMARNRGIESAKGRYVGFVDSDDWVDETMFEKLFDNARMHGCQVSRCGYDCDTEGIPGGKKQQPKGQVIYTRPQITRDIIPAMIGRSPRTPKADDVFFGSACICIFLKALLIDEQLKFANTRMYEDVIFCIRAFAVCSAMICIAEPLYHYRLNKDSLQHSYDREKWPMGLYLYSQKKSLAEENHLTEEAFERLALNLVFIARMAIANECLSGNKSTFSDKLKNIKTICHNNDLQQSIKMISKYKLEYQTRMLMFMLRRRIACALYGLFRLKYGRTKVLVIHLK